MATYDGFTDWNDVAASFAGERWGSSLKAEDAVELIPEPEEVLVAVNHQEDYEGDAWVVFRNGGKYYTVEGSHCSCYGFEGQWSPEEYPDAASLLAALSKGDWTYGAKKDHIEEVKRLLEKRAGGVAECPPPNSKPTATPSPATPQRRRR